MKKTILVFAGILAIATAVCAQETPTVEKQIDRLEETLYGQVRRGSLLGRLDSVEKELYGTNLQGSLAERQGAHIDFLEKGTNGQPSLLFKMSVAEWGLEVLNNSHLPLIDRIPIVEKRLEGNSMEDRPIAMRVERVLGLVDSEPISSDAVDLPAGSVVRLQLMETLKPSVTKKGDKVLMRVTHNVLVNDKLVIPVGAPAEAVVTSVKKPSFFGRPSEIRFSINSLRTLGAESIPLTEGQASKEASDFEMSYVSAAGTSLVGALVLGPIGLAGGFLIRGNAKEIPAGSVMYAETREAMKVPAYNVPAALRPLIRENTYVDIISGEKSELKAGEKPSEKTSPKKDSEVDSL